MGAWPVFHGHLLLGDLASEEAPLKVQVWVPKSSAMG